MHAAGKVSARFRGGSLALLGAALLLGCAEEQPPPQPFGARQVVETRDLGRVLQGFDTTRKKLYFKRRVATFDTWESGRSNTLDDVLTLDVGTGEEQLIAEKVLWFTELGTPDVEAPTLFVRQELLTADAPATLTLRLPSGEKKDFPGVVPSSIGWSDALLVFIRGSEHDIARRELWAGTLAEPRLVSAELFVHDWQFIGEGTLALAAARDALQKPSIYRVDLATGELVEEFPAQIEAPDWAGDDPAPTLASSGLALTQLVEGTLVTELLGGCWSRSERRAFGAADQRCYLMYTRAMSDGTQRGFIGLPDEHREIALPGQSSQFGTVGTDRHYLPYYDNAPLAAWVSAGLDEGGKLMLNAWDAPHSRLIRCEAPSSQVQGFSWRSDGAAYLYGDSGTIALVTSGLTDCSRIDVPQSTRAVFSPQGSRLLWFFEGALWAGGAAGERPRQVLADADTYFRALTFIDEDHLLGLRNFTDGAGLFTLDLTESAPSPRAILEQIFYVGPRLGTRSLMCGNSYNAQDRTGKLSLVDLESFAVEDIAESVADYVAGWPPATGADSFPFAFVRTSRFASPRDGLWVGNIPRAYVERP